ncbi:hypothetical protein M404DRAFT_999549 [Pisolithus tinctorius Marx 270]|uniref:Uncharacterized protein n=1 Tax=Pisolithus tinctorius Marx 270 TaxID=870435 RepID=A0A0C3K8F9_PISTI|nr:hypothetical protein M404DRAFT_999549 [Pisolithus tinctorius Marx 270]
MAIVTLAPAQGRPALFQKGNISNITGCIHLAHSSPGEWSSACGATIKHLKDELKTYFAGGFQPKPQILRPTIQSW